MKWYSPINYPELATQLHYNDNIITAGSCFALNALKICQEKGLQATAIPMGTIYNPISMLTCFEQLFSEEVIPENLLLEQDLKWVSFLHHSSYGKNTKEEFLLSYNKAKKAFQKKITKAKAVVLTLGSAYYYQHLALHIPVNNCHKQKPQLFERKLATIDEIRIALKKIISLLKNKNKHLEVILSISPVKYLHDKPLENNLSKSYLRVAIEQLMSQEKFYYFPAYEHMTEELRDYRFYDGDLCHPNQEAIAYITNQFIEKVFLPKTHDYIEKAQKITAFYRHHQTKGSDPKQDPHYENIKKKVVELTKQYPDNYLKEN